MVARLAKILCVIIAMLSFPAFPLAEVQTDDVFRNAIEKLLGGEKDRRRNRQKVKIPADRAEIQLSYAPLVKQVAPSVVNVYAARKVTQTSPFAGDPFFEQFFGRGFGRRQKNQNSLGSGVIVSSNGIVITNTHVIKNADEVKIALADGREYEASIVLKDEASDLAVLQVNSNVVFPAIELGESEEAEVGDLVLAIGNPFGVGQTVTSGIISAVSRSRRGITDFGFFLQTDAAINPGNSGGALVDMQGRLIGINTAIFSKSGGSNGIGFAIPSDMVKVVLRSSATGDTILRPWIGASLQEVTSEIAQSLGLNRPRGALVADVVRGSPAHKAGIRSGDVILAVNGKRIQHLSELDYRLTTIGIGNDVKLRVLSRGKKRNINLRLIAAPETIPANETEMPRRSVLGGARVANLSPALAQRAKLHPGKTGVVVLKVLRNSPAAANRIRPGDIIREVNRQPINRVSDLRAVVKQRSRRWIFVIERGGRELVHDRNGNSFRQYSR